MTHKVSTNDSVLVRLTNEGEQKFNVHHIELNLDPDEYKSLHFDPGTGIWKFTIWELMHIFGSFTFNGAKQLFLNNELCIEEA